MKKQGFSLYTNFSSEECLKIIKEKTFDDSYLNRTISSNKDELYFWGRINKNNLFLRKKSLRNTYNLNPVIFKGEILKEDELTRLQGEFINNTKSMYMFALINIMSIILLVYILNQLSINIVNTVALFSLFILINIYNNIILKNKDKEYIELKLKELLEN